MLLQCILDMLDCLFVTKIIVKQKNIFIIADIIPKAIDLLKMMNCKYILIRLIYICVYYVVLC